MYACLYGNAVNTSKSIYLSLYVYCWDLCIPATNLYLYNPYILLTND